MFNKEFLRSELFGAEAGSFTGATHRIMGAVERAHGGTLFLDEIGDMPFDVQPMLLRFLDRGEYERVGGYGQSRAADVRLVCATNKDLRAASLRGDFRADLWFRLSIQVVEVPPLRERTADVVAYLQRRELSTGVSAYDALAADALKLAQQHRWDGNFRELANFVERLPPEARAGSIDVATCRRALELGALVAPSTRTAVSGAASGTLDGWAELAAAAVRAFAADYGQATPATWDEVKDLIEKYLKPLLFAHLTGLGSETERGSVDIGALAARIDADRGTIQKQLARYLERFGRSG
jgi:DNA-binding NtrC family response regulator